MVTAHQGLLWPWWHWLVTSSFSGSLCSPLPCPAFSGGAGPRTWLCGALGVLEPGILYVKSRLQSHIKSRLSSLIPRSSGKQWAIPPQLFQKQDSQATLGCCLGLLQCVPPVSSLRRGQLASGRWPLCMVASFSPPMRQPRSLFCPLSLDMLLASPAWALATLPHELEKDSSSWTEKNTSTIQIQFVFFRCKELHSQTLNVIVQLTQGSSAGRTGIAGVAARTLILGSFFWGDN